MFEKLGFFFVAEFLLVVELNFCVCDSFEMIICDFKHPFNHIFGQQPFKDCYLHLPI